MEKQKVPTFKKGNFLTRMTDFFEDPLLFSTEKGKQSGDFFLVPLLLKNLYITTHPDAIDRVLRANHRNYIKSAMNRQLALAFGNGLITSKGDFWRQQRRLMQPAFGKRNMARLFSLMREAAGKFFEDLERRIYQEAIVDIADEMMDVTACIAMKAFFSSDKTEEQDAMYRIIASAQEYLFSRLRKPWMIPFSFLSKQRNRFYQDKQKFDKVFYEMIARRRKADHQPGDLLTTLLNAKDGSTGEGMSDLQLRDEMVTLFSAGHETSANGLSWTLHCLAKNPTVLNTLRSELQRIIGSKDIRFSDLQQLSYTRQVIEEGMRLYPPVWAISREAVKADYLLDYHIPAGSVVFINVYGLHRHPGYWKDPNEFNPARFDPKHQMAMNERHYLPFGSGPRKCIGSHFAMTEMILLLVMFVQRFNFSLVDGQLIRPKAMVTLKPDPGILMSLNPVGK